jgi:hypothetical protein
MIRKEIPEDRRLALTDALKNVNLDDSLDIKLECLSDRSLREAAGQSEFRIPLQAILLAWQSRNPTPLSDVDFDALHKRLGVSEPKLSSELDVFDLVGGAAYYWTDLANIDAQSLIQLMQSSLTRGVSSMYPALIERAQSMQWPEDLKGSAEYTIYNLRVRTCTDPNEAEKLLARVIESGKKLNLSVGGAIVERFELLQYLGRAAEARVFMESSLRENQSDPTLLRYIQALMQQQEMLSRRAAMGAQGSAGGLSDVASAGQGNSSSGIWTPDSGDGQSPESSGGSKLWIPD